MSFGVAWPFWVGLCYECVFGVLCGFGFGV